MGFVEFETMAEKSSGVTLCAIGNGHLGESQEGINTFRDSV